MAPAPPQEPSAFPTHFKRAFSMEMKPSLLLADERAHFAAANPPIASEQFRTLLTWRRSLLFVGGILLIPSVLLQGIPDIVNAAQSKVGYMLAIAVIGVLAGFALLGATWAAFGKWRAWRLSSRLLVTTWLVYFLVPFVAWFVPLRAFGQGNPQAEGALAVAGALLAITTLGPRILSLMPAMLRAGIATKMLFPGSPMPGFLIALAAPFYALMFYMILLMPHQLLGSALFVFAIIGFVGVPIYLWRVSFRLGTPMDEPTAVKLTARARLVYVIMNSAGVVFFLVAVIVSKVPMVSPLSLISSALQIYVNVCLLTVVGTDIFIRMMSRTHRAIRDPQALHLYQHTEGAIEAFVREEDSDRTRQSS